MSDNDQQREEISDLDLITGSLDWTDLSPEDFEKLVFHLLDELGYRDMEWRKGGIGNSATDGGRDLEGSLPPRGALEERPRKCWFEVKLRKHRLERTAVEKTVFHASGEQGLDQLYIITNGTVSNPCLDWVKNHNDQGKHPEVRVLQGHDVEKHLRKYRRVLLRFFPSLVSFREQCKTIVARLVHEFVLPGPAELELVFRRRDEIDDEALVAVICMAESSHGDPDRRRWVADLDQALLVRAVAWIVDKLHELASTADIRNLPNCPIVSGLAYLISGLLMRGAIDTLSDVILAPEKVLDDQKRASRSSRIYCAGWAVQALLRETREHCSLDCRKIATGGLPRAEDYFVRFSPPDVQLSTKRLILFDSNDPCAIGIVDDGVMCPFGEHWHDDDPDLDEKEIRRLLRFVAQVLKVRTQACEPRGDSDHQSHA